MMVLNDWVKGLYHFKVDETAGRLHTLLTILKSPLRAFLTYERKSLVSADIRNSQPLLSLLFLHPDLLVKNKILDRISLYNKNFSGAAGDSSCSSTMLVNFVTAHSGEADILKYRELVMSGNIYEHFGTLLKNNGVTHAEGTALRRVAKTELFTLYFSHNKGSASHQGARIFRQEFPHVYEIFKMIKKGHHNTLACVLQNIEAEIVLHGACKIIANTNPEIPLFTIHDSIATTTEHIDYVKQVLTDHIIAAIDATPEIKLEIWDSSLLQEQAIPVLEITSSPVPNLCHYRYAEYVQLYSMKIVAKELGIGKNKLLSGLRQLGILGSTKMLDWNKPVWEFINADYFRVNERQFRGKICFVLMATDAGKHFIAEMVNNHPDVFDKLSD